MHRALALLLLVLTGCTSTGTRPALSPADNAFLDELQERTFRFFWERTNPQNGLVPDRWPTPSFSSVAAVDDPRPAHHA